MEIRLIQRTAGHILPVALLIIAAVAAGIFVSQQMLDRSRELQAARAYPEARAIDDFELQTGAGEAFTRADLEGQWNLLFFGFANCPDVCPDTLALLAGVMEDLDRIGASEKPQVVFVSVDPERDRGEALEEYVNWFDSDFIGATGSDEELAALTRQLGVAYYREEPDPDSGHYNVDHSAAVMIVDPRARLYGRFGPPLDAEAVSADLFALTR